MKHFLIKSCLFAFTILFSLPGRTNEICVALKSCVQKMLTAQATCNPTNDVLAYFGRESSVVYTHLDYASNAVGAYSPADAPKFKCNKETEAIEKEIEGVLRKRFAIEASRPAAAQVQQAGVDQKVSPQCSAAERSGKLLKEQEEKLAIECKQMAEAADRECGSVRAKLPSCPPQTPGLPGNGKESCENNMAQARDRLQNIRIGNAKISNISASLRATNYVSYFGLEGEAQQCFLSAANPGLFDSLKGDMTISKGTAIAAGAGLAGAGTLLGSQVFNNQDKIDKDAERYRVLQAEKAAEKTASDQRNADLQGQVDRANEARNNLLKTVMPGSGTQLPDASAWKSYFTFNGDTQKQQSFALALERLKSQLSTGTNSEDVQAMYRQQTAEMQRKIRDAMGVAEGAAFSSADILEGMQRVIRADASQAAIIMERVGQAARTGADATARTQVCGSNNGQAIDCVTPNQRISNSIFTAYDNGYLDLTGRSPSDRETCITLPDGSGQRVCSQAS